MSNIDHILLPGERVLHRSHLSRVIFAGPLVLVLLGVLTAAAADGFADVSSAAQIGLFGLAAAMALIGIVLAGGRYISLASSEFVVTDRRVVIKVGLLRRRTLEMQLSKVESISVMQDIMGRLLGYGNIVLTGSGGTHEVFDLVRGVLAFQQAVQAAISMADSPAKHQGVRA